MKIDTGMGERGSALSATSARLSVAAALAECFEAPHFRYDFRCLTPRDPRAVIGLRAAIETEIAGSLDRAWNPNSLIRLEHELAGEAMELAWCDSFVNLVVTGGADDILTHEFAASAYTAAWYMGLVNGGTTPTFAAADTMASHAGWTESAAYSNAARPTLAFSAAGSRSIALSAAAVFNINATATIAGGFFTTVSTISGTTGTLYSAGAFTGGNKAVASGDTLSVSATQSV